MTVELMRVLTLKINCSDHVFNIIDVCSRVSLVFFSFLLIKMMLLKIIFP